MSGGKYGEEGVLGKNGRGKKKVEEQPKYIVCMSENHERAKFMNTKGNASD